jgi:hypothetical protein
MTLKQNDVKTSLINKLKSYARELRNYDLGCDILGAIEWIAALITLAWAVGLSTGWLIWRLPQLNKKLKELNQGNGSANGSNHERA